MRSLTLAFGAAVLSFTSAAGAQQIVLAPANVIGGNGSYNGAAEQSAFTGSFAANNVLDTQTGTVSEPGSAYWLNADGGDQDAFIVIDLGQAYQLGTIELFNTHNTQFNDRGTGQFTISGSNSIAPAAAGAYGQDLVGGTLLVSGTLDDETQAEDPINAQPFTVTNTTAFRYLRFDAETVDAGGTPCCGANNYGLNEIRVFQVPEPTTLGLLSLGGALFLRRRRD